MFMAYFMKKQERLNIKQKNLMKAAILLILAVIFFVFVRQPEAPQQQETITVLQEAQNAVQNGESQSIGNIDVSEEGKYDDPQHVALYLHRYGHLPSNYITKTKAKKKGWIQEEGNLWEVLPGMSIGGGPFTNSEGKLPEKNGREYKECDVNYKGGARGDDRLVYSNDGLVYFTGDHYNTFQLLYGEP